MKRIKNEVFVVDNEHYHDTWKLLKNYRDVVWSLELSVHRVKRQFTVEYGSSIEEFLDSVYLAGADLSGSEIEQQAKCIERSRQMLAFLDNAVDLLRCKHKYGEIYYWILFYTYLSPQQPHDLDEIINQLIPHISDISRRTYYRRRKEAVAELSSVLWGYTSRDAFKMNQV